jgi:hypothetical protein
MRTTLNYVQTQQLNNASASTPGGSTDAVTGLPISTGTNSGDFVELTDAQALALSKTSVGTLYSGIYQRVKLSSTASGIARGQALMWNAADTTDPYAVTNITSATLFDFAGFVIDPGTTAGQYCWMQAAGGGKATALLTGAGAANDYVSIPVSSTNQFIVATSAPTGNGVVGTQLNAAGGGPSLALVSVGREQSKF